MRYLAILLFPILFLACHKSEQKIAVSLPPFSCDSAADDGQFELWDTVVQQLIFDQNPYLRNPDSVVPGYVKRIDNVSTTISLSHPEFSYRIVYDTGTWWTLACGLVDNNSAQVEAWYMGERSDNHGDTILQKISPLGGTGLTAGCKRIYYYGFKQDSFYKTNVLLNIIPGKVLFKGHYDVQVM